MDNFFGRLALVVHWIGFFISLSIAYLVIVEDTSMPLWGNILLVLFPNTVGWLINFIFTGNGKFFPF